MALFQQELTELLDTEIAVVVSDGMAFRGILKKFDHEILILREVYETNNIEVDWIELKGEKGQPRTVKGYIPWRRVTIPEVIIRIPTVMRVWPWKPMDIEYKPTTTTATTATTTTKKNVKVISK